MLCEKGELDVPTTVFRAQRLIAQDSSSITKTALSTGTYTAGSRAFKDENIFCIEELRN